MEVGPLITGCKGLLGAALMAKIPNAIGIDKEFDVAADSTIDYVLSVKPKAIIHCAAYTNVDKAEEEPELCFRINHVGTTKMAVACRYLDIPMIYISTDAVFDGEKDSPYLPEDTPNPKSIYGKSKLEGEKSLSDVEKHTIIRTNWIYGTARSNFITNAIEELKNKIVSRVTIRTIEQKGSPTYVIDLANLILDIYTKGKYDKRIGHFTNEGKASRKEVLTYLAGLFGKAIDFVDYSTYIKVPRPKNSLLENSWYSPHWMNSLRHFVNNPDDIGSVL